MDMHYASHYALGKTHSCRLKDIFILSTLFCFCNKLTTKIFFNVIYNPF